MTVGSPPPQENKQTTHSGGTPAVFQIHRVLPGLLRCSAFGPFRQAMSDGAEGWVTISGNQAFPPHLVGGMEG